VSVTHHATEGTTVIMAKTTDASDGGKPAVKQAVQREHGSSVLREKEIKALIGLACDALSEVLGVADEMHTAIYGYKQETKVSHDELFRMRDDALACLSTSEHYLLMLGNALEDPANVRDPWAERAPFPVYMTTAEVTDAC
jgi:hypothetical protein